MDERPLCEACRVPVEVCVCPGCRQCGRDDGCVCLVPPLWRTLERILGGDVDAEEVAPDRNQSGRPGRPADDPGVPPPAGPP